MAALGPADGIVPNEDVLSDVRSALREANTKEKKIEALKVAIGNMQALPQGVKNIINGLEERMRGVNYDPDNDISAMKSELGMEEEGGRRRRRRGKKSRKPKRASRKARRYTRRR